MEERKSRTQGRLCMVATALLWGLAGVCVKSISWNSMSLMAARSLLSLAMLFAVRRSFRLRWTRTNLMAALSMALTGILYVQSIKLTTAGTAIVLQYIAPILVYLYGVLFRHRKARLQEMLIVAAVFFGCALSFSDQLDASHVLGNILGLLSGVTFAAQLVISNDAESNVDDALIISNILAAAVCAPFMFFDRGLAWNAENLLWVLILGVFQYGLANVLFSKGIQKVEALEGSLILTIEPIFNPIPVWIFCGERMGWRAILGSVIVIGFVTLYAVLPREKKAATE